jgi:hypothetical protein
VINIILIESTKSVFILVVTIIIFRLDLHFPCSPYSTTVSVCVTCSIILFLFFKLK